MFAPLRWYNAYNAVKHDRETEFAKATLGNLIEAMGAVFVLVMAQFGQFGFQSLNHSDRTAFGYKWIEFGLKEQYLPPHVQPGAKWHPVPYRF